MKYEICQFPKIVEFIRAHAARIYNILMNSIAINVNKKAEFLWAILTCYVGRVRVSLEGDLQTLRLHEISGAVFQPDNILKRGTISPPQDFFVTHVTDEVLKLLKNRISEYDFCEEAEIITHVQVEENGELILGAYDNFHSDASFLSVEVPTVFLEKLKEKGVLRYYELYEC